MDLDRRAGLIFAKRTEAEQYSPTLSRIRNKKVHLRPFVNRQKQKNREIKNNNIDHFSQMYRSKDVLSAVASSETTALQAAAYPTIPYPGVGKTFKHEIYFIGGVKNINFQISYPGVGKKFTYV